MSERAWQRRLILALLLAPALLWLFALILLPHVQLAVLALRERVAPHVFQPSVEQFKTFFAEPLSMQVQAHRRPCQPSVDTGADPGAKWVIKSSISHHP